MLHVLYQWVLRDVNRVVLLLSGKQSQKYFLLSFFRRFCLSDRALVIS